jgi:hypothetical protein
MPVYFETEVDRMERRERIESGVVVALWLVIAVLLVVMVS